MRSESGFAARLRWWRRRRGWSQLELAGHAGISQRHLSFLELGRAAPSRDMVIRLAATLDLPLRQHNELLVAAGFAPVWQEPEFGAPELARVRDALDRMLASRNPSLRLSSTAAGTCSRPIRAHCVWSNFWSVPCPRMHKSIWPTRLSPRTCCGRSWSTGPTWSATSFTASRRTRLPTAPPRPPPCWTDCSAYEGCGAVRRHPGSSPAAEPVLPMRFRKGDVSLEFSRRSPHSGRHRM